MAGKNSNRAFSRTRTYSTVVYPDSAPANWVDILSDCKVPAFISPLHDNDFNATGEPKKPHWHVMLLFEGPKTPAQAEEIFSKILGVGCEPVNSLRGMARYLCHLDNPDKAQYPIDKVQCLCGADYISIIGLATDKYKALGEMMEFCEQYNVKSFYLLSKYSLMHRNDWYRVLTDNGAVFMREYLKSKSWSEEQNQINIVDPVSGEVIL